MPYIKKENRKQYDGIIQDLVDALTDHAFQNPDVGELNYVISSVIWKLFDRTPKYKTANDLVGVLENVKAEFLRRKVSNYENLKIEENGDI